MNRIKELRKSAKLSQEELAEKFGVERATISRWENQKHDPSISDLVRLANFFKVSIDYLVGVTNDPTPPIPLKVDETEEELKKYQEELLSLNAELRNLPEDQVREIVAMIKAGLAVRKEINKDKKTPTIQK